jgi:extradiol dioxygenase family protein
MRTRMVKELIPHRTEKFYEFIMLSTKKAFSSFSVNDIQKTKEFYGKTLGLERSSGPEGTLVIPLSRGAKALMYPKLNHQPATFTVLNFPERAWTTTKNSASPPRHLVLNLRIYMDA